MHKYAFVIQPQFIDYSRPEQERALYTLLDIERLLGMGFTSIDHLTGNLWGEISGYGEYDLSLLCDAQMVIRSRLYSIFFPNNETFVYDIYRDLEVTIQNSSSNSYLGSSKELDYHIKYNFMTIRSLFKKSNFSTQPYHTIESLLTSDSECDRYYARLFKEKLAERLERLEDV